MSLAITTTCNAVTGGLDALDGRGEEYLFSLNGTFQTGDQITLELTDNLSGYQTQIGGGYASGVSPAYCYTFNNRVFALAGATTFYSGLGLPTTWNDPNAAGNGFTTMSNWFSSQASLQAVAPYQGKLIFANRDYVQIWTIDPDPANFACSQTLPNIGTMAPLSVQPVGDMDVYMLYDSGVRSVRVRDASNNAIIADIGTPIDMLIQAVLATLTDAQKATACGIVDPSANRYWLYIPTAADDPANGVTGKIYVFSYFPSSQVAAWSTYSPTFQTAVAAPAATYPANGAIVLTYTGLTVGKQYAWTPGADEVSILVGGLPVKLGLVFTATATTLTVTGTANSANFTGTLNLINSFVPQKFEIYKGQVWVRDTNNNLFQYGGAGGNVYENCGVTAVTPFIDSGLPGNIKTYEGIEAAFTGTWQIGACADYVADVFRVAYFNSLSTFSYKRIGYAAKGTHYALSFSEYGSGYARLASAIMHIANPPQGSEK